MKPTLRVFKTILGNILYISGLFFIFVSGMYIEKLLFQNNKKDDITIYDVIKGQNNKIEDLDNIISLIGKTYVEPISKEELIKKAIKGLVANLDAHSAYIEKSNYDEFKIHTDGEFGGLGMNVNSKNDEIIVVSPIEGTPAYRAGIKPEDVIVKVGETSTMGMKLEEVIKMLRGKVGTEVKISVYRKSVNNILPFTMKREIITIPVVTTKIINDVLYLKLNSFDKKSANEVKTAILKNKKVKGIILDLRYNPGGLLDQAVEIVGLFVGNQVTIVSQKGQDTNRNVSYTASEEKITDLPVVVIVNEGSASASEIVSGALQDHKRAIVIGETTFGKGSVQEVIPLQNSEAIKLTIAKYYLPSGRTIQAVGVTPDIIVHSGVILDNNTSVFLKESSLNRHLGNETVKKDINTTVNSENDYLKRDNQINSALNVLKIIDITKK